MNKKIYSFFYLLLIACTNLIFITRAQNLPIDKKATKETVTLYNNLKKLLNKGIMYGHQDDLAYGVGWKDDASTDSSGKSDVKELTGDYPAVYGFELGRLEIDQTVNIDSVPFDKWKLVLVGKRLLYAGRIKRVMAFHGFLFT